MSRGRKVELALGAIPCPFCGNGDAKFLTIRDEAQPGESERPFIRCSKCGGRGPTEYQSRESAMAGWNRRA